MTGVQTCALPISSAVSISIDAVSGVAGFVAAGDRVDILLTRTQEGRLVSSVLLQDITIIAVDQSANSEATRARLGRTVTVEVDTIQAQKLALARQVGKLSLTLRGIGETNDEVLKPVTVDSLSDFAAEDEKQEFKIRVRRAGSLSTENVDEVAEPVGEAATGNCGINATSIFDFAGTTCDKCLSHRSNCCLVKLCDIGTFPNRARGHA